MRTGTGRRAPGVAAERAAILVGYHQGSLWYGHLRVWSQGTPGEVAFDWAWVLAREERYGDIIGFYHTHPTGYPRPSERDRRTLHAWVSCLGKPLLCVIASGEKLAAYRFATAEEKGQRLPEVVCFPRGVVVAAEGRHSDGGAAEERDHA